MVTADSRPKWKLHPSRHRSLKRPQLWVGLALALAMVALAGEWQLFVRVESWWAIILAFPAGNLVFATAMGFNRLSARQFVYGITGGAKLFYIPYGLETTIFYFVLSISEELIFRAVPLSLLRGTWWQVVLLSAVFSAVHVVGQRRKGPLTLLVIDMFFFGVVLSLIFLWIGELWPIVIIHWIRNCSVAKLFVSKKEYEALQK
jgi:membrane protease YdiL (CAAX protease family)